MVMGVIDLGEKRNDVFERVEFGGKQLGKLVKMDKEKNADMAMDLGNKGREELRLEKGVEWREAGK